MVREETAKLTKMGSDNPNDYNVTNRDFQTILSPWMQILFLGIDIVLFFTIVIGNTLVILSVALSRRLQTPTYIFVASLAGADLFVGVVCIPVDAVMALGFFDALTSWSCLVGSSMIMAMSVCSVMHLTVIAYDRYLAITKPFEYFVKMGPKRVVAYITFAWTMAAFFGLAPIFGWNRLDNYTTPYCDLLYVQALSIRITVIVLSVFVPMNIMAYMYLSMFKVALNARRQIAAVNAAIDSINSTNHDTNSVSGQNQRRTRLKRDLKAAKTVALILGCFILAWTPASAITVIDIFFKDTHKLLLYELIFYKMAFSNSAMNWLIYGFRNRDFRFMFLMLTGKIFRCKCWRNQINNANDKLSIIDRPTCTVDLGPSTP
ncbi:adenosine receptor A1-like [Amphiura filiformis]|uniref:adenosine receptor A1-like n=1 Tax=Amphiura filiformis TaxID=82378 RepID=UPI003B227049